MNAILVPLFLFLGAAGAWFGLVDDIKFAFLGGIIAWALGVTMTFRGSLAVQSASIPAEVNGTLRTAVSATALLGLFLLGAIGIWFGLVDDVKVAFLGGLISWAVALYVVFGGGLESLVPSRGELRQQGGAGSAGIQSALLAFAVVAAFLVGAVCVWFGLVDDVKLAMVGGLILWAGAVQALFRGQFAF